MVSICEIEEDIFFGSKRVNVGSCFGTIKEDLWLKNWLRLSTIFKWSVRAG